MSASGLTGPETFALFIQLLIVLLVVRRSYQMARGTTMSVVRLATLPAFILVLWMFSELESFVVIPFALPYLLVVDTAVLVATAWAFTGVAERMTRVYWTAPGGWSYQVGFTIAGIYIVTFLVRIALAAVLFPTSLQFGAPPGGTPPIGAQFGLAVIDGIYSVSVGLLIGRTFGVYRKWKEPRPEPPRAMAV